MIIWHLYGGNQAFVYVVLHPKQLTLEEINRFPHQYAGLFHFVYIITLVLLNSTSQRLRSDSNRRNTRFAISCLEPLGYSATTGRTGLEPVIRDRQSCVITISLTPQKESQKFLLLNQSLIYRQLALPFCLFPRENSFPS